MVQQTVVIQNPTGMHTKISAQFVAFTHQFHDEIYLIKGNQKANAKSLLNLLLLGLDPGSEVTVQVEGPQEQETLRQVIRYIETLTG
ncbi:MAG TPA: HPr family phosphocarrier protein [Firmicutes bacterium]|nr:HPr family phosphocarrier protein [Bacillota bacterium]